MGQAASLTLSNKSKILYKSDHFAAKFDKTAMYTVAIPMVVIAFPVLNAYAFCGYNEVDKKEYTGIRVLDGTIGGLLGVIGWPLSPFIAVWEAYQNMFESSPVKSNRLSHEIKAMANAAIGIDCDQYFNVAIVGRQGTGKSSIINGILGYDDTNTYAAPVNVRCHSNQHPRGYRTSSLNRVYFWDLPSTDVRLTGMDVYFKENFIEVFDCLIIVFDRSVFSVDIDIAAEAQKKNVPVLFVRSKCDLSVMEKINRHNSLFSDHKMKWATAVGELAKETRKCTLRKLKHANISSTCLFLVSAPQIRELINCVKLPNNMKDNVFLIDESRFLTSMLSILNKRKKTKPIEAKTITQQ